MVPERSISVMVIDDSAAVRAQVGAILERAGGIEVVASAQDPVAAARLLRRVTPDVITLDIEMPKMDGLTFLKKLMAAHPLPVVMVSSHTQRGAEATVKALQLGAFGVVAKPQEGGLRESAAFAEALVAEVRGAARCRVARLKPPAAPARRLQPVARCGPQPGGGACRVVVIGSSTGGTEALRALLTRLPEACPPIAIAQHMPPGYTASFARNLDAACALTVKEAEEGDRLRPGLALIAPGGGHMEIVGPPGAPKVHCFEGPHERNYRPSVDRLFHSAARVLGARCVALLLSGMGDDGAAGMAALRAAGAATLGQDEASSVVYGMARAAALRGAVERELPLERLPHALLQLAARPAMA
ncbi:MAG: chemotaxis response regulator protein-glutamate methylesterase [Nitrospirae bacterium]|nr:MAG: chemotaxis response regulator protein-glutamate methylesterase [Nitrospirota bacterium]